MGATVELTGGQQIPTLVVNVEPIGTRRLDNLNLLDIRGEKRFPVGGGHELAVRLNLYNALNNSDRAERAEALRSDASTP